MEEGGKDCEEETLQTAFKKLRVDAESVLGTVSVSESSSSRSSSRSCLDVGAKPKLSCSKDNWHGSCMRKSSRCSSRTQRRRRSKSPILHPPKFTYCSAAAALSPPGGCLKHQRLTVPEPVEPLAAAIVDIRASSPNAGAQTELPVTAVFGSCVRSSPSLHDVAREGGDVAVSKDGGTAEKSACDGAAASPSDFRSLSELHGADSGGSAHATCRCAATKSQEENTSCRCRSQQHGWNGVEVYSFTGLRDVINECERKQPTSHDDGPRTLSTNGNAAAAAASSASSGSPRSCSEQARGYVDDITIEDLSGYMEFYLYIPKKMSHMAEMMYT